MALGKHPLRSAHAWGWSVLSPFLSVHTRPVTVVISRHRCSPQNHTLAPSLRLACVHDLQPPPAFNTVSLLLSLSNDKPQMLIPPHGSRHLCELEGNRSFVRRHPALHPGSGPGCGWASQRAPWPAGRWCVERVKKAKASFRVLRLPPGYPAPFKNQTSQRWVVSGTLCKHVLRTGQVRDTLDHPGSGRRACGSPCLLWLFLSAHVAFVFLCLEDKACLVPPGAWTLDGKVRQGRSLRFLPSLSPT